MEKYGKGGEKVKTKTESAETVTKEEVDAIDITIDKALQWYHSQFDESTEITTLKELDDIEDILPFTRFQLAKI